MNVSKSNIRPIVCALLMAAAGSGAFAQAAGAYFGSNSQGKAVQVIVADDGAGVLRVTGLLMYWTADCSRTGPGRDIAWVLGANEPIAAGPLAIEYRGNALYERWSLAFDGNALTGTFQARTPEFIDIATSTRGVQLCSSGSLTFAASLQPTPSLMPALKAGEAMQLR